MPRYRSNLSFHYPIEALYKEPLGYIEGEEWKSKKTIVHCCRSLFILESASLCPFGALSVLPKIAFACELAIERWRIEVVEDVDVFVTSKCIHLCILCIVPGCLFQDVSIM